VERIRQWAPLAVLALAAAIMAAHGPIPQLAHYHEFADARTLLGIPHAMDVLSNAAFAVVGLWGLRRIHEPAVRTRLGGAWTGYALFMVALVLTAAGSSYYHLAPDDARLVWDRIPIALACAGLISGVHAQTHDARHAAGLTAALAVLAVASVLWWSFTGDLRPYLLLQGAPLVLVPAWQALARSPRRDRAAFGLAIGLYVAAKAAELFDHRIFEALGFMSGHTLKHLLAAAASVVLVAAIVRRG
jgi:predicted membrane channel-forming protein YqfA (hemolysin III family)